LEDGEHLGVHPDVETAGLREDHVSDLDGYVVVEISLLEEKQQ